MSGTAIAATGGNFILGHSNSASHATSLKNTGNGPALNLANGHAGSPPFTIHGNKHVVPGLNAKYLGGHPSSDFAPGGTLPPGQSESGVFAAGSGSEDTPNPENGWIADSINYQRPLSSPIPDENVIDVAGVGPVAHCPGPGQAARGYLCLYNSINSNVETISVYSDDSSVHFSSPSVGVFVYWKPTDVDAYVGGEWTVTAP